MKNIWVTVIIIMLGREEQCHRRMMNCFVDLMHITLTFSFTELVYLFRIHNNLSVIHVIHILMRNNTLFIFMYFFDWN